MRRLLAVLFLVFSVPAPAQNLPYHADPDAREEAPDLSRVPAIRFLTTPDFPPFNYRGNDGTLIGFNIDLAEAVCETLNLSCTMQAWPWDQAADALAGGQGDALIAALAITGVTAERFDFSNPYLMFPARFVTKASEAEAFSLAAESPMKVAVREGSAQADFLAAYFAKIEKVAFPSEIAALEAMKNGEAAAYFGDAMRASFWLNGNPGCCAFAGDAYFNPGYFGEGMAVAVPPERGPVRAAINYALQKLKRGGKLDELYLRWFPVSFY